MKIGQIGEDTLIEEIKQKMNLNLPVGIVGIGDDCAAIPLGNGKLMLLSTDSLVEGCHFIKDKISAKDLGYKAVMVNVSDIAAMGGRGLYVLMSIALPKETEVSWVKHYIEGVKDACQDAEIVLIGGDTTGSKAGIFINFTIVGEVLSENIKFRKGAKEGDVICITDFIGDSLAGYELMMKGEQSSLIKKHCRPKAQFEEGTWLGEQSSVKTMMDISDGLLQDLGRMTKASGCAAEVDIEKIPLSAEFRKFAKERGWSAEEKAIISGEEYCLLFTVESDAYDVVGREFEKKFTRPLYSIGVMKNGSGVSFLKRGQKLNIESQGYLHFKQ